MKRLLAIFLVLAMLMGQTEAIIPRARAAEPDASLRQREELVIPSVGAGEAAASAQLAEERTAAPASEAATPTAKAGGRVKAPFLKETSERRLLREPGDDSGLRGEQPSAVNVPFLAGPTGGQWTQFALEDRDLSITIPAAGFAAGVFAIGFALTREIGMEMYLSFQYTVKDADGEEVDSGDARCNVWTMNGGGLEIWKINWPYVYFHAEKAGTYTVSLTDSYIYLTDDSGEQVEGVELAAAAWKVIPAPEFGYAEETFAEPFALLS